MTSNFSFDHLLFLVTSFRINWQLYNGFVCNFGRILILFGGFSSSSFEFWKWVWLHVTFYQWIWGFNKIFQYLGPSIEFSMPYYKLNRRGFVFLIGFPSSFIYFILEWILINFIVFLSGFCIFISTTASLFLVTSFCQYFEGLIIFFYQ